MPRRPGIEQINKYLISHTSSREANKRQLHIHPNSYEINLVKRGNVDFQIGDQTFHMKPGDLSIIRPNQVHGYQALDDSVYERFPVHIEESYLLGLCTDQTNLLECLDVSDVRHLEPEQIKMYEYYVDESIQSISDQSFGYDIRVRSNLSILILLAAAAPSAKDSPPSSSFPRLIQDTLAYIDSRFTSDISLKEIADAMNISSSRLCHTFKKHMGISLWNYVIVQRINYAQSLLNTDAAITDVCYECGFRDYAHFIKVFHKLSGVTPGQYQRNKGLIRTFNSAVHGM